MCSKGFICCFYISIGESEDMLVGAGESQLLEIEDENGTFDLSLPNFPSRKISLIEANGFLPDIEPCSSSAR